MLSKSRFVSFSVAVALAVSVLSPASAALAESRSGLREDAAAAALDVLYKSQSSAKLLAEKAKAILVFPHIYKAGFVVGASYGHGVLYRGGKVSGYYNSVSGSYGLLAGA